MSVTSKTFRVTAFTFEDAGKTRVTMEPELTDSEIDHIEGWLDYNGLEKLRDYRFRRTFCQAVYDMHTNVVFVDELKRRTALGLGADSNSIVSGKLSEEFEHTFEVVTTNLAARGMLNLHAASDDLSRTEAVELTRVGKIVLGLAYGYQRP